MGLTADPCAVGDQIVEPSSGRRYEVKTVQEHPYLNSFLMRECQMAELTLWRADPATVSTVQSRASDARERTTVFIDTYIRNAQITKNDDVLEATWVSMYYNPPYPLTGEFRADSAPVHGIYAVDHPTSTANIGALREPYSYTEIVPVHIITIDSEDVTGTVLQAKCIKNCGT